MAVEEPRFPLGPGAELRPLRFEDAEELFAVTDRNRERLREWLPWVDKTRTADDTRAFIESTLESDGKELTFGVVVDGALVGAIGMSIEPENRSAMIGYWLAAEFEGRGLMTEATRVLCDQAFGTLGLHRVWIGADPANALSWAIPERLGFKPEGVFREDTFFGGKFRDSVIYGMLEDEWRSGSLE